MKYLSVLVITAFLVSLLVSSSSGVVAQSPARKRPVRAKPATRPKTRQTAPPSEPKQTVISTRLSAPPDTTIPTTLAILNGQTITLSDLEPAIAQEVAKLGEKIAEVRREVLELQINTVLLGIEAKKRRLTSQELYDLEVAKRITAPTEAEITKFIEDNRAQLGESDAATIRSDVLTFIKAQREQKLSEALVRRLKITNPVVQTADLNSPDLKPATVIATVGGQSLTAGSLNERLKPLIYKLRLIAYQVTRAAVDRTLNDLLLLAEAKRQGLPPENIVRAEITEKVRTPTDAEVEKFYMENKERISADFASVKFQIANFLREKQEQDLEHALSDRLRKNADLRLLLTEPEAPVQVVNTAGEPSRGDVNAPVTLVEFTDFECPACAAMHPVLEEVLPAYGNKVRLVVRNYPLAKHAHAHKAAEAADAANAQGKFFEYTALLFKRQDALDVPSLKKYATEIGLNRARFDAELDRGVHAKDVRHDLDDGQINGIDSTPTIFINGVKLNDLTPEGLRAAIDKALVKAGAR